LIPQRRPLLGNYRTLLEGIAQDLRKISRFGLLTDTERERILLEWNQTAIDYPRDRCIHELFQEARSRPAVAVIFGGEKLTYGELDLRASRLAGYLKMAGVGRGARVAISMEPSVEMIVGLLGILKVGAAYVPIDPEYPQQRMAFLLEDSESRVLLTQRKLLGKFSGEAVKKVFLDGEWESIERVDKVWQESWGAEGSALAYVLYTSGSTGTPKGVCAASGGQQARCQQRLYPTGQRRRGRPDCELLF
jgi:non-ribosomal peptide synthetase component F